MARYDTKTGKGPCPLHDRGFTWVTLVKDLAHVIRLPWAETPERQWTKILPTPSQKDILALAAQYLSMNTLVHSAKKGNPLSQGKSQTCFGRHAWLNFRAEFPLLCSSGWLVGSFGRWCLVGWSHFSLSRPVCHWHGKLTCHVHFQLQTVKLKSFRIYSIAKLGFVFFCLSNKTWLCHIRVNLKRHSCDERVIMFFFLMLVIPMCLSVHTRHNVSVKQNSFCHIKCSFRATCFDSLWVIFRPS